MKICPHCNKNLPLEDFYINNHTLSNRQSWCKNCMNLWKKEHPKGWLSIQMKHYRKNRGKYLEIMRDYGHKYRRKLK